jgi:hypothetical protein
MARELVRCDQCGQTDDHPMAHFGAGGRSVHHDCMSADEKEMAFGSSEGATIKKITELAESGVHGDELAAKIESFAGGENNG